MEHKLIISVKEARKLLGKSAQDLSDDQVSDFITQLTKMAAAHLKHKVLKP